MHADIFIWSIVFDEQLRHGQLDSRTSPATASFILDPRGPGSGSHDQGNNGNPQDGHQIHRSPQSVSGCSWPTSFCVTHAHRTNKVEHADSHDQPRLAHQQQPEHGELRYANRGADFLFGLGPLAGFIGSLPHGFFAARLRRSAASRSRRGRPPRLRGNFEVHHQLEFGGRSTGRSAGGPAPYEFAPASRTATSPFSARPEPDPSSASDKAALSDVSLFVSPGIARFP
jgi:hypothetical protein